MYNIDNIDVNVNFLLPKNCSFLYYLNYMTSANVTRYQGTRGLHFNIADFIGSVPIK